MSGNLDKISTQIIYRARKMGTEKRVLTESILILLRFNKSLS